MAAAAGNPNVGQGANTNKTVSDLEANVRQLREDISKLTEQLAKTGQHGYGAAKRAAADGVDHLKAQGEAALGTLRTQAHEFEDELTARVKEKPLTSLAIAAGIGYLLAVLSRR
jgi:ElaB/YqjD/DUF883 family membrane-anchored ribosome-binding protein